MIRVLLADDHQLFREGLKRLLETVVGDIEICALAATGEEAIQLIESERPDLVLMDLQMPGLGGVGAVKILHKTHPDLPVVVLTTYDEEELVFAAMQAGAAGYLLKDMSGQELAEAIRKVRSGKRFVDPGVAARVISDLPERSVHEEPVAPQKPQREAAGLSPRELQILRMLVDGKGNREIAERFHISEGTAKNYVSRIYAKINVSDRAQAVAFAIRQGLA